MTFSTSPSLPPKYFRTVVWALLLGLLYLVWDTGIHSDDYPMLWRSELTPWSEYLFPSPTKISVLVFGPVSYYFDYFPYYVFGYKFLPAYDLIKWCSTALAGLMTYRFALDYLPRDRALLATAAFLLFPIHDATLYWHVTLIYALTPAIIMYAHHLIRHEKNLKGTVIGLIGAFCSYASPPYTFGLAMIFLLEKAYRKAALFVVPGVLYVIFYFVVSRIPGLSTGRIESGLALPTLAKQFFLQIATFLDAGIGPSLWLKLWYSIGELTIVTILLVGTAVVALIRWYVPSHTSIHKALLGGLACVAILSFAMFALTGLYPQMAFNLGNRVTVYGCLFLAFLLASLPLRRIPLLIVISVFLASVGGLSDHWTSWNHTQKRVIENVAQNHDLAGLPAGAQVFTIGHAYSHLGPMSHIEFSSERFVVYAIFQRALGHDPQYNVEAVGVHHSIRDGYLVDRKYGGEMKLPESLFLYNFENNTLTKMSENEFEHVIASRPHEVRHWLQLLSDGWLRSTLLALMPRLKYLFES